MNTFLNSINHRPRTALLRFAITLAIGLLISNLTSAAERKAGGERKTELATFGGGCFWCMEALFERFNGVKAVTSGYAGGKTASPNYKQVCTGETGHAEVVQVEYEPDSITYDQLLEIFWDVHNPTTLNRQGADEGTQYRSVILYHNEAQKKAAEQSLKIAAAHSKAPIVTEIVPLTKFYPAEEYHQDYFRKNPNVPYCTYVISPKLQKLEKHAKFKLQSPKP
jgi:peptide-methionine (S)-S-oxide reductase